MQVYYVLVGVLPDLDAHTQAMKMITGVLWRSVAYKAEEIWMEKKKRMVYATITNGASCVHVEMQLSTKKSEG